MSQIILPREETLISVFHPQFIDDDWVRVDHPAVAPLSDGAPALGWEGDQRLVVYLHKPTQRPVLWRLEADGEYRPVAQLPEGGTVSTQSINALIARLVERDTRRGFDAYQHVMDAQAAQDRAQESTRAAWLGDFSDKFHYALSRSHLPGVDITRVRNVTSRGG